MSWEQRQRCRYYPDCLIHTGDRYVRDIEPEERAEIKRERESGKSLGHIGNKHNLEPKQVLQIVNQPVVRYATRRDWLAL